MSRGGILAALVILTVVFGLGSYVARNFASKPKTQATPSDCRVDRVRLDSEQMSNAATIAAVGLRREVGERGIVVALAAALQESKLRNLEHLGRKNDHDSLGLFQQRPSQGWGTAEQIMDQRYAAERFYSALMKVKGWERMRVTEAAQRVQRSAFPEAYQKWADEAQTLASALTGSSPAVLSCEARSSGAPPALASERFELDFGRPLITEDQILRVPVADAKTGWQFAHWFVAHAEATGLGRVTFGDRQWSRSDGAWQPATPAGAQEVVAEILN